MNNTSVLKAIANTDQPEVQTGPLEVYLVILVLTLSLHLLVQFCIHKARLHNNNYYLIRALSLADSSCVIFSIFYCVLGIMKVELVFRGLKIIISALMLGSFTTSLLITIMIVSDRWIAMEYALRYHSIVTKQRIARLILVSSLISVTIHIVLLLPPTTGFRNNQNFLVNPYVMIFSGVTRLLTCVLILILVTLTIRIRNRNEANIQNIVNFHGTEAERLDTIQRLTRSIKDVLKLNIWTCVFLVPLSTVSILRAFQPFQTLEFGLFIALSNLLYLISNPIVYLTCFTQIRQYWYRALFVRNTIDVEAN